VPAEKWVNHNVIGNAVMISVWDHGKVLE